MKKIKLSKYVEKIFETPSKEYSEWFGYYNYDTLTSDHSKLLCNRIKEDGISPRADLQIEIGYYDIPSGIWHHVGDSDSWNWQQGCMAQWLNDAEIIYNSSENGHHIAIIYNIKTHSNRKIDWAIYGITPDGKKSFSLDMERAHWCRAYHYESVKDFSKDGLLYEEDGIFEIDLEKNTCKRIISIQDIIALDTRPYFKYAKHWLEHIMINRDGTKFCVLHRFSPQDNVYKYCTRLIIVDAVNLQMQCVKGWEHTQWSHFGWNGNDFAIYSYPMKGQGVSEKDFITTLRTTKAQVEKNTKAGKKASLRGYLRSFINAFLPVTIEKRIRGNISYYQYYKFVNGKYELDHLIKNNQFLIDGHPSFNSEGTYMITDTYPDNTNFQRLYYYNTKSRKVIKLGTFYANYTGNPASCDLHPKLSKDGKYIVVDSAHDDKHHMIVLKIKR